MNIKVVLLIISSLVMLSACVIQPAHRGHNVRVKVPVKTVLVLDKEHHGRNIVVVNAMPAKKRNCWNHNKHWHCNR